jgi:thioredoxin-related protein
MQSLACCTLLACALASVPCRADQPAGYPFVPFDEGLVLARKQDRPIFLYFGRYGCTWCDLTNKEAFADPEVRQTYTDHYVLIYVDAESGRRLELPSGERITEAELGARLKVFATPLFAFLRQDMTLIGATAGIKSVQDLKDMDRFVTAGHFRTTSLGDFLKGQRP